VTIVRPIAGKFYPDFFGYMLLVIEDAIKEAGEGCGGQTELARSALAEKFSVHYPESLPEQERIVGVLDDALDAIAIANSNAAKNIENTRALFESHLQAAFSRGGNAWKQKTLADVASTFGRGRSKHRPRNSPHLYGGHYPFIQTGDIRSADHIITKYSQTYSKAGLAQSKLWPKGTICITIAANIAETAILGFDACFPDSVIGVVANPMEAEVGYIEYLLQSYKSRIQAMGKGSAQANINLGTFQNERFPFPSVTEQTQIVDKLDRIRGETQYLESIYQKKLVALAALRKSLLNQAFTGQLRIQPTQFVLVPPSTEKSNVTPIELHAGILAMAYQLHEKHGRLQVFTHVKAEKIVHMAEARVGLELGRKPVKDAAGPNDFNHLTKVEHRARKANYFDFKRVDGGAYRVQKLGGFDKLIDKTHEALGDRLQEVEHLLQWMLRMSVQQAEIATTVFAAWNNLLMDGTTPTDEQIVHEARENWHANKLKIERQKFFAAVKWLREQRVVPEGKGKRVAAKKN
jgi:type I restriction enzyme S subunit